MTTVNKILRKVRRIPEPRQKPIARINQAYLDGLMNKQVKNGHYMVRDRNFKRAQHARALQVEAINAEKQRQADIAKARLKNLKKARRKLAKIRSSQ